MVDRRDVSDIVLNYIEHNFNIVVNLKTLELREFFL